MDPLNSYVGPTGGVPPAVPMAGVHSATPVIPKLYWDAYDDEQRIKLLWKCFGEIAELVNQLGYYYVPTFAGEWDATKQYPPLTVVSAPAGLEPDVVEGDSYTAIKWVPVGTPLTDTDYWALTGNYNANITALRQAIADEATNRVNADNALQLQIDNLNNKIYSMTALGFIKGEESSSHNDELIQRIAAKYVYVDDDFYFSNPITLNGNFILSGPGTLIYNGNLNPSAAFINIYESESSSDNATLKNKRIELHINCNNLINGISSLCGYFNKYEFYISNVYNYGVTYTAGYGYDNLTDIFVCNASEYSNENTTGAIINKGDEKFGLCVFKNCKIGVSINGSSNTFNEISGWTYTDSAYIGSILVNVISATNLNINSLKADTYNTFINFESLQFANIENIAGIFNTSAVSGATLSSYPPTLWNIKAVPYPTSAMLTIVNIEIADKVTDYPNINTYNRYVKIFNSVMTWNKSCEIYNLPYVQNGIRFIYTDDMSETFTGATLTNNNLYILAPLPAPNNSVNSIYLLYDAQRYNTNPIYVSYRNGTTYTWQTLSLA